MGALESVGVSGEDIFHLDMLCIVSPNSEASHNFYLI
jgi:hypothetical protein